MKYTNNEISNIINKYGFELIEYIRTTNIIANDSDGYLYKLNIDNLKDGSIPSKWMKNPYAVHNLKLYLSINHPDYIWIIDDDVKYKGCKQKYNFICKKHFDKGLQQNTFDNIINSHHTCRYCGYEKLRDERVIPKYKGIELCVEKNVLYYGKYTKNNETIIQYICPIHNDKPYQEMSLTHFKESVIPCRYCNVTKGEYRVQKWLDNNHIKYDPQHTFNNCVSIRKLRFDFYLIDYNICIEYDGQGHYFPINFCNDKNLMIELFELGQERDKIKTKYCIDNNIKLIRIPYWDYDNIENILDKELKNIITESSETAGY